MRSTSRPSPRRSSLFGSNRNLQNIPIRTEEGRELRRRVRFFRGHDVCLSVRLLADRTPRARGVGATHVAERGLQSNDQDIHTHTARLVFQRQDITPDERRQAKAINFGIIYGKTPWGLSGRFGHFAQAGRTLHRELFPIVPRNQERSWTNEILMAQTEGYVETAFKRRSLHPQRQRRDNYQVRENGKRMAMNAPIQGTAADLLKIAMVKIRDEFARRGLASRIILQIHDEPRLDVPEMEKDVVAKIVVDLMEHAVAFAVLLKVEGDLGAGVLCPSYQVNLSNTQPKP
ncbi:MAG: DNA polymerase, partial [Comamonadaceae bacterium]|nr:DNA polymerase [Comamonadaceae bacterium]